jgi:hypothetical protein
MIMELFLFLMIRLFVAQGIKAFMKSHICSDACKLLGLQSMQFPTNYALDEA